MQSPQAADRGLRRSRLTHLERRRLALALLLSLLTHALLFRLNFTGQDLGFPGFGFPWQDRRAEVREGRELRVVLDPPRVATAGPATKPVAKPSQPAPMKPTFAAAPVHGPSVSTTQPQRRTAKAIVPQADRRAEAMPQPAFATRPAHEKELSRPNPPRDAAPAPIPERIVIAVEKSDAAALVVPSSPPESPPVFAAALSAARTERLETARVEVTRLEAERQQAVREAAARREVAQQEAARQEASQVEVARLEGERLEAARQEAAQQAAARRQGSQQEADRQEAAQVEAARLEAERQEAAQLAAARRQVAQQEAARKEAARVEASRLEGERLEAARHEAAQQAGAQREVAQQEAARQEAAQVDAERQEAARLQAAKEVEEHREAVLRAIGRQLDAEAAQRAAASTATRQPDKRPYSLSTARRGRLWGRADPNADLIQYAEAWERKIQLNTPFDVVRELAKHPHHDPLVTVAIRSDGSVESVTIVISSGSTEIDEAIRRIVQSHEHYQAFPPRLIRDFDVIEIRRTWYFDVAVRLY